MSDLSSRRQKVLEINLESFDSCLVVFASGQLDAMDVVKAVQGYITKIVDGTSGIKVLLLDNSTVCLLTFNPSFCPLTCAC